MAKPRGIWVPVDVKLHWLGLLNIQELARCAAVSRSWATLVGRTVDAAIVAHTGVRAPALGRAANLQLLYRLQHAGEKEHMGYLLSWAAGSRGACVWRSGAAGGLRRDNVA
jgi:hypothetical protein